VRAQWKTEAATKPSPLESLKRALDQGTARQVHRLVNSMHPAEIASLLESLPPPQRDVVWDCVDPELEGEVLVELNEEVRGNLIRGHGHRGTRRGPPKASKSTTSRTCCATLPETVNQRVLRSMDSQDRERLSTVLSYDEDTAGGLMNTDAVSVRPDVTLETVLRYLRMRGELPDRTDALFVVNRHDRYLGSLYVTRLLTEDADRTVGEVMDTDVAGIAPETPANEVAALFEDRDLVSAAVVSGDGRLLGRITVDDVVDVIRDEADHSVMSMAGLDEDADMFAGVVPSARRRGLWLGINLATAFLAARVVGLFEATIDKVVALAVLMPIVASMGGVAGTQTLTLIVRGLALGQIERANARWLLMKEIAGRDPERDSVGQRGRARRDALVSQLEDLGVIFAAMVINLLRGRARRSHGAARAETARRRSRARGRRRAHDGDRRRRLRVATWPGHAGIALSPGRSSRACAARRAGS
jgi:magnesium transporter